MDATPIIIKKKKGHSGGHHGGSWKVAYADFVTAMMAFFMVMWIMGLSDETRAQIQGYFKDPLAFAKTQQASRTLVAPKGMQQSKPGSGHQGQSQTQTPYTDDRKAMDKLKQELEKALKSPELAKFLEHIKIQVTAEGLRIEFLEDKNDFFETGSAELKPGALKVINALGPSLTASGRQMIIEGHTDSVPFNNDPMGNLVLSSGRASSLADALGKTGVPNTKCSVKGLADRELRDPEHPASGVNRRVSILLPFEAAVTASERKPKDEISQLMDRKTIPGVSLKPQGPNLAQVKK